MTNRLKISLLLLAVMLWSGVAQAQSFMTIFNANGSPMASYSLPAINKVMFDTKSKKKIMLEREAYGSLVYCAGGRCAIIAVTLETKRRLDVNDDELEGLASIPRQIEGVEIGITIREKEPDVFKISVRANERLVNAAQFCARFGGGGHAAASGCMIKGSLEEVTAKLRAAAEELL